MIRHAASPRVQQAASFAMALLTTVVMLGGVDRIAQQDADLALHVDGADHAAQVQRLAAAADGAPAQVVTITARRG